MKILTITLLLLLLLLLSLVLTTSVSSAESVSKIISRRNNSNNVIVSGSTFALAFFESSDLISTIKSENRTLCSDQVTAIKNALKNNEFWAIKLMDAWAKIPSGLLYGHTVEMGNFDECLSINQDISENEFVLGKYCLANANIKDTALTLSLGICVPAECNADQLNSLLNEVSPSTINAKANMSWIVSDDNCSMKEREPFKALDWVAVAIFSFFGLLLFLSTAYDYYASIKKKDVTHSPLLMAFSIKANLQQLLKINESTKSSNVIPALNGIRCMSMIYIVYLHSYMMLILSPAINTVDIEKWSQNFFYMVWKNGSYAVDTFFFLSGLLLILVSFRTMEKNSGKLNIPQMYFHRYLRISPVVYLAMLYFMTLFRFSGNGPIWKSFTSSYKFCDNTWWATLLYVQNYAAAGKMCLGHSWYLAVDFQLFLLSPLVLILIWRWRRIGLAVITITGLLLVACLFSIVLIGGIKVFSVDSDPGADDDAMRKTYYSTHSRTSAWIVGILLGYYIYVYKNRRVAVPKILVLIGWMSSILMLLVVIFSLHWKTKPGATPLTPLEGAFFLSLSRVAWPLALAWIVFACEKGYAGPVNQFLSWWLWQPLSKLCYCLYIWHFLVVTINTGQIKTNTHFSIYDGTLQFFSDFSMSLILSLVMYLAIEAPMLNIDKCLLSGRVANTENNPSSGGQVNKNTTVSQQNLCD